MANRRGIRAKQGKPSGPKKPRLEYFLLALILVFFAVPRIRLGDLPLERDEGEYAYAGQLLLQGIPPYALAYNMKLPGTYVAYAATMALFGQTPTGIHIGLTLVNGVTTALLFFLALRILDSTAAVVTAAAYAILSTSPAVLGFAGHATHFVVLAAMGGVVLLLRAIETPKLWKFLASGLLLGSAFLMKQPGIFFLLFGFAWLAFAAWRRKIGWREFATRSVVFVTGAVLPFALTCLWVWKAGVFARFWFWTFTYARAYGSVIRLRDAPQVFWTQFSAIVRPELPIWLLTVFGLLALLWKRKGSDACFFAIGLLVCAFFAVCPGFYFREHYFIPLLPAAALLVGAAVSIVAKQANSLTKSKFLRAVPVLLFAGSFFYALWTQWDFFFEMDAISACRTEYSVNPFPEALQIAKYLKAHTSPAATLAILGSEPEIYFYAHRRSATGYIYTYPLMEPQLYAAKMQEEMIEEIERNRPEFIVFVNVPFSWLGRATSQHLLLDWAQGYLAKNYQLDGLVDILDESQYLWGEDAANSDATSPYTVRVYKRSTLDPSRL